MAAASSSSTDARPRAASSGSRSATAFLVFGAIALVARQAAHGHRAARRLGGAARASAALVVPTQLGPVERAWMGLAHAISKVTTPIFMGDRLLSRPHADRPRPARSAGNSLDRIRAGAPRPLGSARAGRGRRRSAWNVNSESGDYRGTAWIGRRAVGLHAGAQEVVAAPRHLIVLRGLGALLVFAQGSALAPFIYTIF